ncbi:hypothetical protein AXX17_AT4G41960 [Arabidopsis thaliana]|uniref:Uncharacterized protein n=1 Tax=Arabidopsis thaliana TaxID=3702 RepID=A0A178V4D2_ARATH|nr:hypothetical protein AXX17_AT4G41960 [Arabidopsis thaliana]
MEISADQSSTHSGSPICAFPKMTMFPAELLEIFLISYLTLVFDGRLSEVRLKMYLVPERYNCSCSKPFTSFQSNSSG